MASRSTTARTLALVGAGVVAILSGAPPGLAATSAPAGVGAALGPSTGTARDVTLVTGQRVHVVTRDGRATASVLGTGTGAASALSTIRQGGHLYVVPVSARRLLGGPLDPALFDVSDGSADATRHAVTISYAGNARPSVPGVTITSAAAGQATGYVTDASAPAFGAALARETGSAQAPTTLFGSVTRISSAAARTGRSATPQGSYPMYTLVLRAIGSDGRYLESGAGFLMSMDDGRKVNLFFFIDHGRGKVSVPAGRYLAVSDEFTPSPDGMSYVDKAMVVTDYEVKNNLQTLTLDARKATAKVQPVTFPRPATIESQSADIVAQSADGFSGLDFGFNTSPPATTWLPPTPPPAYGTLGETTSVSAVDPAHGAYHVDGAWTDNGIPAGQRHRAPSFASMDRLDSTFYADGPHRTGGIGVGILTPSSFFIFIQIPVVALPVRRAEYTFGPSGSQSLTVALANAEADDPGFVDEGLRPIVPGQTGSVDWMRNPLRLGAPDTIPGSGSPFTLACRTATSLLAALLLLDGESYHSYEVFGRPDGVPIGHYTLYRNGVPLADADDEFGEIVPVTAAAATYRVVETLDRAQADPLLSTTLTTDVTFRSSATSGASLPAGACPAGEGATALPLLRADVDPNGSLTGSVPVGTHDLMVTVDHPALAETVAVTSVAVHVRPTGSTGAWSGLPVTRTGAGRYAATLTSARGQVGSTMDLRVDATDAAGGILHQTTTAALRIGN